MSSRCHPARFYARIGLKYAFYGALKHRPERQLNLIDVLTVIILAASPISELRGAIPVAVTIFHMPWYYALALAFIGNLLPVPFILLFLDFAARLANKTYPGRKFMTWLFRTVRKRSLSIEKYERAGLALFVAIPLPVTGAWTGAIAASLLGFKFRHAFISIVIGIVLAGTIVTLATLLGWSIVRSI